MGGRGGRARPQARDDRPRLPDNLADSCYLDTFYDTLRVLAAETGWVRVRGTVDHVTMTVRGKADEQIEAFTSAAQASNPGGWAIFASAYPPLIAS